MPRLFVAITFPREIEDQLHALCSGIHDAKWIEPGNIHLTLKFFGEVTEAAATALQRDLATIRIPAFDVRLARIGTFPTDDSRRARILWAGVEAGPEMFGLQQQVVEVGRNAGANTDDEPFTPHVTLARFKRPPSRELAQWRRANKDFGTQSVRVTQFKLMSSDLEKPGPRYRTVAVYPLR